MHTLFAVDYDLIVWNIGFLNPFIWPSIAKLWRSAWLDWNIGSVSQPGSESGSESGSDWAWLLTRYLRSSSALSSISSWNLFGFRSLKRQQQHQGQIRSKPYHWWAQNWSFLALGATFTWAKSSASDRLFSNNSRKLNLALLESWCAAFLGSKVYNFRLGFEPFPAES